MDPYVAEMKGVILGICPEAVLIDITHEIEKFNVMKGAFTLASVLPFFPQGSIHVAVIDPGVGGSRKPLIIEIDSGYLIGPDNGLLSLAAEKGHVKGVYEVTLGKERGMKVSSTFHGRDVFAPAAAYLARGIPIDKIGFKVETYVKPRYVKPVIHGTIIECTVLHIDVFGNVITNLSMKDVEKIDISSMSKIDVSVGNRTFEAVRASTYSDSGEGTLIVILFGSQGFLELAVNRGSAGQYLGVRVGSKLTLRGKTYHSTV